MATAKNQIDIEEIRAQVKAELMEELQAKYETKVKKETEKRKALEEKLKEQEKNMEAKIKKEEKTLRQRLEEFPKVWIEIPEDPNNPDDVVPVGWNGIIYAIPRGKQFQVPKPIYDTWKYSYDKTKEVNKRIRESTKKEITIL